MTIRTRTKDSESRQQALFHEDINSALQGLIAALGGAKVVGSRLYPDLPTDGAARRLLDAINPDRAQQLSQTQFLTLLKWGRKRAITASWSTWRTKPAIRGRHR